MTKGMSWSKFQWTAWETDPALAMCSMAAQGFWMRLLCLCAKADGQLLIGGKKPSSETLAHVTRQTVADVDAWLSELSSNGVFSRTRGGVIYSRRMRDDREKQGRSREFGKRGGNPALVSKGKTEEGVNPPLKVETETETETEPPTPTGGGEGMTISELVEACWSLANKVSRGRSSKADLRTALEAARKRGHSSAEIVEGVGAYFAGRDAIRDEGAHAKGVHRIIQNDRWQSHLGPPSTEAVASQDDIWRSRLRGLVVAGRWKDAEWGPRPGQTDCEAPQAILREFETEERAVA